MPYATFFDFTTQGLMQTWSPVTLGALFFVFSIALWFKRESMMPNRSARARKVIGAGFMALCAGWTLFSAYRIGAETLAIRKAIKENTVMIAAGEVSRYKKAFDHGDFFERFCVQNACFAYSDYLPSAGFHTTGKPIAPNLPVRVFYTKDVIIRLDFVPQPKRQPDVAPMPGVETE
jgi:hypothetical protein